MRRHPAQITKIIIHCAATPNGRHFSAQQIDAWHAERGFQRQVDDIGGHEPALRHIGYHFVVYTNGAIANGRHPLEVGAHTQGHNSESIGVCLIGTNAFTRQQWRALKANIEALLKQYPGATVHGHREFSAKECPGFDARDWLAGGMEPLDGHLCHADTAG